MKRETVMLECHKCGWNCLLFMEHEPGEISDRCLPSGCVMPIGGPGGGDAEWRLSE